MAELLSRFRVAITVLLAPSVALILVSTVAPSHAGISDRAREPVVISLSDDQFPRWVDQSISADVFELWAYHDDGQQGVWKEVPYQIDQLKPGDPDALPQYLNEDLPGTDCDGDGATGKICGQDFTPSLGFPCEQTYFLRGTEEPTEPLRTDDELVFLAGRSGACDAPLDGWPSSGLTIYRHRIFVADGDTADCQDPDTECGCVYLFRRTAGQRPHDEDLIDYVLTDDATHWPDGTCRPTDGACGSIVGDPADVDGDGALTVRTKRSPTGICSMSMAVQSGVVTSTDQ